MMKYLFYDIECMPLKNGKFALCEFGYLICDEKFNNLKKATILISPGCEVCDSNFPLHYPIKRYYQEKTFAYHYLKIKELLTNKDFICLGYDVRNDINFLDMDIERYHLTRFNYTCFDIKKIIDNFGKQKQINIFSLTNAYHYFLKENKLISHYAMDDAEMSKEVIQKILIELNRDLSSLIIKYPSIKINSEKYLLSLRKKQKNKKLKQELDLLRSQWNSLSKIKSGELKIYLSRNIRFDYPLLKKIYQLVLSNDELSSSQDILDADVILIKEKNDVEIDNIDAKKILYYQDFLKKYR